MSISKNQSIISLWVQEPSFSNTAGTVNFEGIVLNPGFIGTNAKVATINFRVKQPGIAPLSFASGEILANDGQGTDILSKLGTAQFSLIEETSTEDSSEVLQSSDTLNTGIVPIIESLTHPVDAWSSQTSGIFKFILPADAVSMRLLLDDKERSTPTVVYEPPVDSREIPDLKEGISYLHLQYKNENGWSPILHYKILIDTHFPESFSIVEVGQGVFKFDAKDPLSGIAYFKIQIDDGEEIQFIDTKDHIYTAPFGHAGEHSLKVKAFDKAGNYTFAHVDFFIHAIPEEVVLVDTPTLQENLVEKGQLAITVLSIVIPFVALVIVLFALLYLVWHKLGGLRKRIDTEVLEAKMIVHRAFTLLRTDLEEDIVTLEKASRKRKLTREESKILKRLRINIDQAENIITKEIGDIEKEITK